MNYKTISFNRRVHVLSFVFLLILSSCTIRLIGPYDQTTDLGIQKIQSDVTKVIVKIESNIDNKLNAENRYDSFKSSYGEIESEILNLEIRCGALPKYEKVAEQVKYLDKTIQDFESAHKMGFSGKKEVETDKTILMTEFQTMISLQDGLKRTKK